MSFLFKKVRTYIFKVTRIFRSKIRLVILLLVAASVLLLVVYSRENTSRKGDVNALIELGKENISLLKSETGEVEPTAVWHLNEKEGVQVAEEMNDFSGVVNGVIEKGDWVHGKIGNGLRLDGTDDYIGIEQSDALNIGAGGSFSLSVWFKAEEQVDETRIIAGKGGINGAAGYVLYLNSSGQVVCGIDDDSQAFPEDNVISIERYDNGEWHWIVCVKDINSSLALYVNGGAKGVDNNISAISDLSSDEEFVIGGDSTGYWFNGIIDEVVFYNYSATAEEIWRVFRSFQPSNGSGDNVSIQNLEGHWMFDESSYNDSAGNVLDSSPHNRHGTTLGSPSVIGGVMGNAISFDGVDDQIRSIRPGPVKLSRTNYTISLWFNTTATSSGPILEFGECNANECGSGHTMLGWRNTNGNFSASDYNGTHRYIDASSTYRDGVWHFVVMILDSQSLKLYIDGKFYGENTAINSTNDGLLNPNYMIVGARSRNTQSDVDNIIYYKGKLDDLRVYSRALTSQEIADMYAFDKEDLKVNNELKPSNLLAQYDFEKKSGTTVYDSIGGDQNGTMQNMTAEENIVKGKIGNALDFNGVDENIVINSTYGLGNANVSISAWVNLVSTSEKGAFVKVGSGNGYGIGVGTDDMDNLGNDLIVLFENVRWIDTNTAIGTGWHHIVLSIDNSGIPSVYLDGRLIGTYSGTSAQAPSTTSYIGGYATGNRYTDSSIDNVKIYGGALTAREVAIEYNGGAPIGYWKMDEEQGEVAHDYSGNNHHGTLMNMDTQTDWLSGDNCKLNGCLDFDGSNDYVSVNHAQVFNMGLPSDQFTLSAWIKTSESGILPIISKSRPTAIVSFPFYFSIMSGKLAFERWHESPNTHHYFYGDKQINDGKWHLVTFVNISSSDHRMYVDGVLDSQNTMTWTLDNNNTQPLYIAKFHNNQWGQSVYSGLLDEIKIFKYALSEEDIKREYNLGAALRFN